MNLVIAEKPSVAMSIAKVLGATQKSDGYTKGGEYIVTWCVGHLIELAQADAYNPDYAKWKLDTLPIVPTEWQHTVSSATKKQYEVVKKLLNDKDVDTVICATDAGREGELIFRLVYNQAKCKKPFKRLWINSMEESEIKKGFSSLKPGTDYNNLYNAALARSQADWLVGINGTRLFSCLFNSKLNVGRVMTPTLAMLVERDNAIKNHIPEKFYNINALCGDFVAKAKVIDKVIAEQIKQKCDNKSAFISSIKKQDKKEAPPKLFDLTTLQREANKLLGYTAQQTLDYTQALYEKKLVTYPRTDSQYLTEDVEATIAERIEACGAAALMKEQCDFVLGNLNTKIVINNKKVTDHHAIIPTTEFKAFDVSSLPQSEKNIALLIIQRFLSAVYTPMLYSETEVIISCEGEPFKAKGKVITSEGWKAVYNDFKSIIGNTEKEADENIVILPELQENQEIERVTITVDEKETQPPKPYTEDTLLSAMENAGNKLEAADNEDIEKKGLGTPATRAGIIEKLIKVGFVERQKKNLLPTKTGINLIAVVAEDIKSPRLTAEWEYKLLQIEKGELSQDVFIGEITKYLEKLVNSYKLLSDSSEDNKKLFQKEKIPIGFCPVCHAKMYESKSSFYCESNQCNFIFWKNDKWFIDRGKLITKEIVQAFLQKGKCKIEGLKSQKGSTYNATVIFEPVYKNDKIYCNYRLQFDKE